MRGGGVKFSLIDRQGNQQTVQRFRPARPQRGKGRAYSPLYVEPLSDARTKPADFFKSLLVRGAGWLWAEPGCVLEDALWAGVMDELLAADETLLHRHLAPGAEAIGEVG